MYFSNKRIKGLKIIFLDFDGVINGYSPTTFKIYDIAEKLKLIEILRKYHDIFGVHILKVYRLAQIVRHTGAKVVISSSWRRGFYYYNLEDHEKEPSSKDKTLEKMHFLFRRFGIQVIGITPTADTSEYNSHREFEIKKWLEDYPYNVASFVVLDDEVADLKGFRGGQD